MRLIGFPGAGWRAGRCSDRFSAAARAHYSQLYTAPGFPASGSQTRATTRALCTASAKGPTGCAKTIGDYRSRRVKTGYAAPRAQTAAGSCLYAANANHAAAASEAAYAGVHPTCATNSANERYARCANAASATPTHQG